MPNNIYTCCNIKLLVWKSDREGLDMPFIPQPFIPMHSGDNYGTKKGEENKLLLSKGAFIMCNSIKG